MATLALRIQPYTFSVSQAEQNPADLKIFIRRFLTVQLSQSTSFASNDSDIDLAVTTIQSIVEGLLGTDTNACYDAAKLAALIQRILQDGIAESRDTSHRGYGDSRDGLWSAGGARQAQVPAGLRKAAEDEGADQDGGGMDGGGGGGGDDGDDGGRDGDDGDGDVKDDENGGIKNRPSPALIDGRSKEEVFEELRNFHASFNLRFDTPDLLAIGAKDAADAAEQRSIEMAAIRKADLTRRQLAQNNTTASTKKTSSDIHQDSPAIVAKDPEKQRAIAVAARREADLTRRQLAQNNTTTTTQTATSLNLSRFCADEQARELWALYHSLVGPSPPNCTEMHVLARPSPPVRTEISSSGPVTDTSKENNQVPTTLRQEKRRMKRQRHRRNKREAKARRSEQKIVAEL